MGKQGGKRISKEKVHNQNIPIMNAREDTVLDEVASHSRIKRSRIESRMAKDVLKKVEESGIFGCSLDREERRVGHNTIKEVGSIKDNTGEKLRGSMKNKTNPTQNKVAVEEWTSVYFGGAPSESIKQQVDEKPEGKKRCVDKNAVDYYKSLLAASRISGVPLSSFKKLKYAYPSLKEKSPSSSLYGSDDQEDSPTSPENTGFYNEKRIDISSRFENDTFICHNTHSYISCFDCSDCYVVVGLKGSCEPFNIFEFQEGPSEILILDKNLNAVSKMAFSFGGIVTLKIRGESLFVLFRNGSLVEIQGLDQDRFTPINSTVKVTKFDANSTMYVYTNGNELYNSLGQSRLYDSVIIDLAISENFVFVLDINGRIVQSALDFTNSKELYCKYTFNKITFIDGLLIALEDDVRSHTVFFPDNSDSMYGSFVSYFLGLFDGTVSNFKRYRGKRRCRKIFQVARRDDGIVFHTSERNFSSGEKLYIPAVKNFGDSFMFATENGLILKVFYE